MIAALDVHYGRQRATAAGILFEDWTSESALQHVVETVGPVAAYEPGSFYKRELPCLLAVLAKLPHTFRTIIIDGYVWLDPDARAGLGAHLFQELGGRIPVVGVAKSAFRATTHAIPVLRGRRSRRPLYVSAAGMGPAEAAENVARMHGPYRLPTLLKLVDRLARSKK